MGETVKTYKVLRDGMLVGESRRDFGDFMPEAEQMENLRTLLNSNVIETVYVDPKALEDWRKDQDERDKEYQAELRGEFLDDDEDEGDEETPSAPVAVKSKKRVAKKPVAKKRVAKKKGKTSGLAEQSV